MVEKTADVEMMRVMPDIGQVGGILRSRDVQGPMRDYAEKRMMGEYIDPALARAAYKEAKKLVDAAKASGKREMLNGVSTGILEGLLYDISHYVKSAAAREAINKVASKFEEALNK